MDEFPAACIKMLRENKNLQSELVGKTLNVVSSRSIEMIEINGRECLMLTSFPSTIRERHL
jgi:hypothetical protein